jgi:hypothetical protein
MIRPARLAATLAAAAAAACGTTPPPLPPEPAGAGRAAAPPVPGDLVLDAGNAPPLLHEELGGKRVFRPSREGEAIHEGITVHFRGVAQAPGEAAFLLRNGTARDFPNLLVQCVFAAPGSEGELPFRPVFVTAEAPVRAGSTHLVRVALPAGADAASGVRIIPGVPEILTMREEDLPGTTFLGGRLECTLLDARLTQEPPSVEVVLRPTGKGDLPPIEAQLLLGRGGRIVWTGPWIVVPSPSAADGGGRRLRWSLSGAPETVGCTPYLRVRDRR